MNLVRYGLVGFGAWGKHHADAIAKAHNAELVGIAAHSDATAQSAREAFPNAFVTTDYRELITREELDVIDVVVPSDLHHEVALAVLQAGKHLLLEKPMGITLAECDSMILAARQHDRLLCVGHELRLSSMWGKAKQMIEEGFIGSPQYCLVELSRNPLSTGIRRLAVQLAACRQLDLGRTDSFL